MNKTLKLILIYTILFGVLTIGLFVLFILAHKSFIQYGDGYKQGYFWVVEVRQQLHDLAAGEGLHMWSWSKGLGMNVSMGYIIDPFMIIAALFPPGYIELGYTVANLFKMYCGGLVFLLFCKYVELDEYKCLVGSLCYTFSAWFIEVALSQSSLLMNAYLFPLLVLSVEWVYKKRNPVFFIIVVAYYMMRSFYFSYSVNDENGSDIILVFDESLGEFVKAYGFIAKPRGSQNDQVTCVIIPHKGGSYNDYKYKTFYYTKTEVKNDLMKLGTGYTVVVINSGEGTGTSADDRYKLRTDRANAQKGVINPGDVEQYKEIAKANLKRYKDLLAQMRLERKKNDETAGYDKLIDEYEKIQMRVIKMIRGVTKNPKGFSKYDVDDFLTWLRDEQRYNSSYRYGSKASGPMYYGEYGLMYYFKSFMDRYMSCFGDSYKSSIDASDYKNLELASESLKKAIDTADQKLKKFGF